MKQVFPANLTHQYSEHLRKIHNNMSWNKTELETELLLATFRLPASKSSRNHAMRYGISNTQHSRYIEPTNHLLSRRLDYDRICECVHRYSSMPLST